MVILAVYTNHIKVKYKSNLLSKATFFVCSCGMLTIILPFIFAYKSGGFWLKRDIFYEQPRVNVIGDYLLLATTENISNPVICSTFPYHKENLDFLDVCSTIKLRQVDDNFDGKSDKLYLHIALNTFENPITSINLFLPITYRLNTVCPLQMQSAIIYQNYLQNSVTDFKIVGDLSLFQSGPIHCYKKGVHDLYDYPVINNEDEMETVIEHYWERNLSTQLSNVHTTASTGNKNQFNLKLTVRYPEHRIYYKPGFWHILKYAWIQYFSIYVIIVWLINGVKRYIFNNRLVLFYKDTPLEKKNK